MCVRKTRHLLVAAIVAAPLAVSGCGLIDDEVKGPPPEDAAARSRERVQAYLDAMKTKDVAKGRSQLCTVMHEAFDKAATGPNGDFAEHFTVPRAVITDVRAAGGTQVVTAAVTVSESGRRAPVNLRFTVTKDGGQWCIAGEAGASTPTAAASP